MNPLGFLVMALGVVIVIIGFKGSQHKVLAAIDKQPVKSP